MRERITVGEMCAIQSFLRDYSVEEFLRLHKRGPQWFGVWGHTLNSMSFARLQGAISNGYEAFDENGVKKYEGKF